MLNSPSFASRPFAVPPLIATALSNLQDPYWQHLISESRFLGIFEPFAAHVQGIRAARIYSKERMDSFDTAVQLLRGQLESWRVDVQLSQCKFPLVFLTAMHLWSWC